MPNSINTNVGALVALQNLNATSAELDTTQARINTGKRIASAKDNGAVWAIAQNQRATSMTMNAVKDSLQRGQSIVDVAMAAGETVSDLLLQMKEKALAAADSSLDAASRTALSEEFVALRLRITSAVSGADFNGANMLRGALGVPVRALADANATAVVSVAAQTLTITVLAIATAALTTKTLASTAIGLVTTAITNTSAKLARLGTGSKALGNQLNFVGKLQDAIDAGVGNLVDADLAKESAKLQSLQTKQQLGIQALSIANQSSSILLGLFR